MRRGKLGLTFAMAAVMLTVGCTGQAGDPPTTEPPPPSVTSPTPTPTSIPTPEAAIAPERPDMSQVDDATAEAVATYFLKLHPYVYATGDLTDWRALSHPECVFCASVVTNVEEMVAKGNTADGGLVVIDSAIGTEVSDTFYSVVAETTQGSSVERGPDGTTVDESAGGRNRLTLAMLNEGGAWIIREVQVDEAAAQ